MLFVSLGFHSLLGLFQLMTQQLHHDLTLLDPLVVVRSRTHFSLNAQVIWWMAIEHLEVSLVNGGVVAGVVPVLRQLEPLVTL